MNQKGFIASSLLYGMLALFLTLMISTLFIFGNNKLSMDRLKEKALNDLGTPVEIISIRQVYAYHLDQKTIGNSTITDGVEDYTALSSYQNGKKWFLKYEINASNVIQKAWACMKYDFITEPVCIQGGGSEFYSPNRELLQGLADLFTSNGGSCVPASNRIDCSAGELEITNMNTNDYLTWNDSLMEYCEINGNKAYCGQE